MHRAPRTTRQRFLRTLACAVVVMAYTGSLWAQPATIRLVVGYPAGATSDLLTRVMAEEMSRRLNRPVIVENKAGAGGRIANELVKAAPADGTTLLMTPVATMAIFPHSYAGQLRYDPLKDFVPVAHLTNFQLGLGVGTAIPARSVKEYVDWVKSDPDKNGFYGSAAPGSIPHFFGVMLGQAAGIPMTHVPYKGTAEQMLAVASGQVMVGVNSNGFAPFVDNGQLRLLATMGAQRSRRWSQVPTLRELGHGIVAESPYGLAGPAGMPAEVVQVLHDAFKAAMHAPAHVAELAKYDQVLAYLGPQDYGRAMRAAYEAERLAVQRLGLARKE